MDEIICEECKYAYIDGNEFKCYLHKDAPGTCADGEKDYIDSEIIKAEYHYEEGLGK